MDKFTTHFNEAIGIWSDIVGESFTDNKDGSISIHNFQDYASIDRLNEIIEHDPSCVTSALILKGMNKARMDNRAFSFTDILNRKHESDDRFRKHSDLAILLEHPEVESVLKSESDRIVSALHHYKANEDTMKMAKDHIQLGLIREKALLSMKALEVHQFAQGKPDTDTYGYNESIYLFLNVTSAVNAIQVSKQRGVTLAYIFDNSAQDSEVFGFFAFFVYDGGTLTMLTDRTEWAHPAQSSMIRSSGRQVLRQTEKTFLPYDDIAGLEFFDKNRHVTAKKRSGLLRYDVQGSEITSIAAVNSKSVIYIVMMLDLINQKYLVDRVKLPETSFTMESVHPAAIAHDTGERSLINIDKKFKLKSSQSDHDSVAWETENNHGFFSWVEKRYEKRVDKSIYDVIGSTLNRSVGFGINGPQEITRVPDPDGRNWREDSEDIIKVVTPDSFGTLAELQDNSNWHNRYNKAVAVNELFEKEVSDKTEEVHAFIREALDANFDNLVKACAFQELKTTRQPRKGFGPDVDTFEECDLFQMKLGKSTSSPYGWPRGRRFFVRSSNAKIDPEVYDSKYRCCITEKAATLFVRLTPSTPQAVADVLGVKLGKLPLFLQHYYVSEPYTGNSILRKIDPMDWVVENHVYKKMRFSVLLTFSKNAYNAERKKHGLGRIKDWSPWEGDYEY